MALDTEDLQGLLYDERQRNVQHRHNFDKLKEEHVNLQADYVNLQKELQKTLQAMQNTRTNQAALLQKADKIILEKEMALIRFRQQVCTGKEVRKELEDEMRATFSNHVHQLRTQLEKHRTDLHEANMKVTSLEAKIENIQRIHRRAQDELTLKFKTQVQQLEGELQKLCRDDNSKILNEIIALQRDQVQLQSRNKSLAAELSQVRNECNAVLAETQAATLSHKVKLTTIEEEKRLLEFKLDSVQSQKEALEQTLSESRTQVSNLVQQMSSIQEEKLKAKSQLAEVERKCRTEMRLLAAKQNAKLECGHEQTFIELTNARLEATLATKTAAEQKKILASKEEEFRERFNVARSKDYSIIRKLESEKMLLEEELKAERSTVALAEQRLFEQLKKEKEEMREKTETLQQHIHLLEEQRLKDGTTIDEHIQQRQMLEQIIQQLRLELQRAQTVTKKDEEISEKWERDKRSFVKQIRDLESDLHHWQEEYHRKVAALKQKYKKAQKALQVQRTKLEALMVSQSAKMRANTNTDEKLRQELDTLKRKHLEFQRIIEAAPDDRLVTDHALYRKMR
ncbi:centrosomal protein of 83 kDa-like isoform X2 [Ornithodoros turicata]|uniref:centrosomal protein of 83 kDa-like isoform X2 n=1 Tax=Ornithodoros turicata TaxID=34597 RepID=UPI00313A3857